MRSSWRMLLPTLDTVSGFAFAFTDVVYCGCSCLSTLLASVFLLLSESPLVFWGSFVHEKHLSLHVLGSLQQFPNLE